jgi:hypothetical protein
MTMPDGCGLLIAVATALPVAFFFGVLTGSAPPRAEAPDPAPAALRAEAWTPCDPPRPDVACWRSGHAVVCLPLTPTKEAK